jgi:hypothetical protein
VGVDCPGRENIGKKAPQTPIEEDLKGPLLRMIHKKTAHVY